ncbi:MAG: 16S rRNA (cytosine(1402)-N(4))-methyltransferase, partial [Planctomycetota bacterium]
TAADLVARLPEKPLADLLYQLADERGSRRIARKIIETRRQQPIKTVGQLAELVRSCLPRPKKTYGKYAKPPIDPATRTFMALRMAVNRELDVLVDVLDAAIDILAPGGRLVVVSFHSGEDRLVKNALRDARHAGTLELLTKKPVTAGDAELDLNPRARSAKLRAGRKLARKLPQNPPDS